MNVETVCASDYKRWSELRLPYYCNHSEEWSYYNQIDIGDKLEGNWYWVPDKPKLPNGDYVVIVGTFGNYNSPGHSHWTQAIMFESKLEFLDYVQELKEYPEYLEIEEEEELTYDDDEEEEPFEVEVIDILDQDVPF